MTTTDSALKAKHRALWALGDYPAVATDLIPSLGPILVAATGIGPGQRVLDVAAGTGNVAIPAALAGADVVASDLTPELLQVGEKRAAEQGARLAWEEADAEHLPYRAGEFDVVVSCVGVMFAPMHQLAADELIRVTRPGGSIGLIAWTPEGFIGQLFATMKPYVAPPPPGAQPPPLWGSEAHVAALFGDRVSGVVTEKRSVVISGFPTGAAFRDYWKGIYGPTIAAYRGLADDPERTAALDQEMAALGDKYLINGAMEWEYLLYTASVV
ncbi:class I SAM-dependent methyltransferase [Cryptosporangium aurantiacum]|uniref:Ubiquinone/menaquinone biosynthesis C-methylase UbiE n=1 Tax=Cryptosporangium aurantiacum TaxID=134849 RepID=A0A1M7L4N2_9ACTN|nr:class I SAM-dependent methyltransferase [Cryptosporangium aurantiacum]SHM72997.1 Ubiquinone/menaquinone biosynthesis C-methylase UbiE [Cryptosporangium aurantiacum]